MAKANTLRKPRPPRDQNRIDSFTGILMRCGVNPKTLSLRGRPRGSLELAFAHLAKKRAGKSGPDARLEKITRNNFEWYLRSCAITIPPAVAGVAYLGVGRDTITDWIVEGADPECDDPMKVEFSKRTREAVAAGYGYLHERAIAQDPVRAMQYAPIGRAFGEENRWERPAAQLRMPLDGDPTRPAGFLLIPIPGGGYRRDLETAQDAIDITPREAKP